MADPHAVTVHLPALPAPAPALAPAPVPVPAPAPAPGGLVDQHRMRLYTELIRAGVPPHPGDLRTIGQLAELDEAAVTSVARWIQQAARLPACAAPVPVQPDPRADPRLMAW